MRHSEIQLRRGRRCVGMIFLLGLLLLSAAPASALEVQQVRWGFDGKVVPGRFNLLSVLVANSSPVPFDGAMRFYKSQGMDNRVGALYGAPCYLSPATTRWLQFYVFVDNAYDQWRLEWGRRLDEHQDLEAPKLGSPAQVLLTDSDPLVNAGTPFPTFPDELFPPTVAATSGLKSLLLDHVPRWEPAKRLAFLHWLRTGGKVHLLLGADGYPVFTDELSVLNTSETNLRIGAGWVIRHPSSAHDLRRQEVADAPEESAPDPQSMSEQTTDTILRILGQFAQMHYHWGGIYLLAFAYLGLAGPGQLLFGRKLADYRLRLALLLATIAGFALLFNLVGRRGQGEASVIHSLSYARAIDDDTYEVMQWVNVFATRGARYTITHPAPHNLYSTGQDYEAVDGMIQNGRGGQMDVDIPMYSRRAFLHAAEMKGVNIPVRVVSWDGAATLKRLVVSVGPDFLTQVTSGWVVLGDQIYAMKATPDDLEFDAAAKQPLSELVNAVSQPMYGVGNGGPVPPPESVRFQSLAKPLIAWSLGVNRQKPGRSSPGDDHAQLFLFAHSPQGFGVSGSELGQETGYVLYHFDLFHPPTQGTL